MEFRDLPAWTFKVDEVSFGVYTVVARDLAGRKIVMSGTDAEGVLESCRQKALAISKDCNIGRMTGK